MIFYRTAIIDIDAERRRITKVKYNKREKKVLRELCNILETDGVEGAAKFLSKHHKMAEFVGHDIYQLLWERGVIGQQWFTRKQLESAWAKRDKQGKTS